MMRTKRLRLGIVGVTTAGAAVLGMAALPGARAAEQPQRSTAAPAFASKGIPAAVNPDADLAAHTPGSSPTWNDSIYVASRVKAGGHDVGILVHTLHLSNGSGLMSVAVTDDTSNWHKDYQVSIPAAKYSWSKKKLDISMPGLTWTGDAHHMSIRATTPWGAINAKFAAQGPALDYAGTGLFNLLGDPNDEFALPSLRTTGTLTIGGKTSTIAGESWLDRQWGDTPLSASMHWTWMNISLSNGDKVAIWDAVDSTTENSWATVLHPDGSYELAAVRPLADGASGTWTSPTSGSTYPTCWVVDIPSLKAQLRVKIVGPKDQELVSNAGARTEATAVVGGIYEGGTVTGQTYVEMVGNWKQP